MSIVHRDPQDRVQVLDKNGDVVEGAEVPDLSDDKMVEMYAHMRLARRFDERAVSLQRQGRMGTYPPLSGQEAAQVGSAHALDDDDWIIPSYREHAAVRVHGLSLEDSLLYWMGHEKGNEIGEGTNVFTVAVPIAT
ncbi:MAG: thiamine pyrophosphate-dependent enzyme, partial [Halobacteria archaeon]|nr:thiamine pyrophosphate-dependent enzyme [Halobacteria archaeon]